MQRQRTAARGNATMFLMPLEGILMELKRMETESSVTLLQNVAEIKNVVKVVLKSYGALPSSLITKATIRREVVIRLIEEEKNPRAPLLARTRHGYGPRQATAEFLEGGAVDGLEQQIPHDDTLDNILVQKAASPHPVAANLDEVLEHT